MGFLNMAIPSRIENVIIGAGIHGLSTAWQLAKKYIELDIPVDGKIAILDKTGLAAGASGIACGVIRNNYFQPAMRKLMAHSVEIWESDPRALHYHPVGYMQVSCESMRADIQNIHHEQQLIAYESVLVEGENNSNKYMREIFDDWQAKGITSVLHEKRGGYSNQTKTIFSLAKIVEGLGVTIYGETEVLGFISETNSTAVKSVETNRGSIECDRVVIGAGPWIRDLWSMLELPQKINIKNLKESIFHEENMWRYWQLEEGVLKVNPEVLRTNKGAIPPVMHVDTDATLYSDIDGSKITDEIWGIYYKPDPHFGGVQGGASPYKVETPVDDVAVDPYGPSSTEFISSKKFANMWVSALAHCHKRFEGTMSSYHKEPSGGIGCFTPDSFPIFDHFRENVSIIADSNHGWKMIGVGHLMAEEILGNKQSLLDPFRFNRFEQGNLHPVSNSPYPWS
jgi:glycine/D-amino acid oxidase-like deaminating enzyme